MKRETLQSLLADRSLGELEPQTQELLEAYLAFDAAAAAEARKTGDAVEMARRAVAKAETEELPQPRWMEESQDTLAAPSVHRKIVKQLLPLAACVTLGIGVGWLLHPTRSETRSAADTTVLVQRSAADEVHDGETRFWSMDNPRVTQRSRISVAERRERGGIWNRATGGN